MIPTIDEHSVAWISTDQMREIDRIMIEDLHIELIQMMENAGRNLAAFTRAQFAPNTVTVYAGAGGNGGGGLVAARHLANAGVEVQIVLSRPASDMSSAASHQLDVALRMGLSVSHDPVPADLAIDALIGYGLVGDLRGADAELAEALGKMSTKIVSLDAPTGLDTSSGNEGSVVVSPDATLTLVLPKIGLADRPGDLYLADISVPPSVTEQIGGRPAPPFELGPVLRLDRS
jgi:NAD(P)H-hydrate epimerase